MKQTERNYFSLFSGWLERQQELLNEGELFQHNYWMGKKLLSFMMGQSLQADLKGSIQN